jgi:hypothetical protein
MIALAARRSRTTPPYGRPTVPFSADAAMMLSAPSAVRGARGWLRARQSYIGHWAAFALQPLLILGQSLIGLCDLQKEVAQRLVRRHPRRNLRFVRAKKKIHSRPFHVVPPDATMCKEESMRAPNLFHQVHT